MPLRMDTITVHHILKTSFSLLSTRPLFNSSIMKFFILFAAAASASRISHRALADQCDTSVPTAEYLAAVKEHQEQRGATGNQSFSSSSDVTRIPLYVHVVAASQNESDGYLTVRLNLQQERNTQLTWI